MKERIGSVVGGVVRQAVADAGAAGVYLQERESPEAGLARAWCAAVCTVYDEPRPDTLSVHPANKTALLLGTIPAADLLPLGDLYASEVAQLTGDWSAPEPVCALVRSVADVASVDGMLRRWAEGRDPDALTPALADAVARGRFARLRVGLVPKLSARTLGIDLWE